ncbi:cysteine hydrolase family protein [Salicibibacter kimchii]|uniref:Cysteine hydrolase n=1 Tax=Salicibibacter kimchii TaxID=2099786 RepID=A0A345BYT7_9BACI|nr:isochorismatase family cysteine hydrolase [Salicibibacter kimchii]AXF56118.1 cysteine hydrolase [Salicibibacter kimchii]
MKGYISDYHKEPTVALLIIDMINDLEFAQGKKLYEPMRAAANQIATLKAQAKSFHVPVIYVNDNYGYWQSDFKELVNHCLSENVRGQEIARMLPPADEDYFVLKPQFSGFFYTPLDLLLRYLNVRTLILTGASGNMCVQFTANDAYMRGYKTIVPRDCIASAHKHENEEAIQMMENVLGVNTAPVAELSMRHVITEAQAYYEDT